MAESANGRAIGGVRASSGRADPGCVQGDPPLERSRTSVRSARIVPRFRLGLACVIAAMAAWGAVLVTEGHAAEPSVPEASQPCLGCHGTEGMEKKLDDGGTLSLHVPGDAFGNSVHAAVGCTGCHADVSLETHPGAGKDIKSARDFSIAMSGACRTCHEDEANDWQSSVHAALVREGSAVAPVCSGCHSPHAVMKNAAASIEEAPCKGCHADIYAAYLGSMHAKARLSSDQSPAPVCWGCHSAHDIKPAASAGGPKGACLGCHQGVLEAHQKWLPNAALHFEVVSCPACHAPTAQRKVDLMLVDSSSQTQVAEQKGVPLLESRAGPNGADGKGLDAATLWNLLRTLNREGAAGKATLRGRLEVRTGPEAHQLTAKSQAISDCKTCHRAGADAFRSVTISVAGPDGRRIKFGADSDVLNSVISIDSVGGFYAIGGTRIELLDILLILALLGGVGIPVAHMTIRFLAKRYLLAHPELGGTGHRPGGGDGKVTT